MRHKREIIVVQGTELIQQKSRSYKELIKQLNASGAGTGTGTGAGTGTRARTGAGDAVAIHQLPSRDIVLTMVDKKACTSWLADQK
jgi:hypothetical protein